MTLTLILTLTPDPNPDPDLVYVFKESCSLFEGKHLSETLSVHGIRYIVTYIVFARLVEISSHTERLPV